MACRETKMKGNLPTRVWTPLFLPCLCSCASLTLLPFALEIPLPKHAPLSYYQCYLSSHMFSILLLSWKTLLNISLLIAVVKICTRKPSSGEPTLYPKNSASVEWQRLLSSSPNHGYETNWHVLAYTIRPNSWAKETFCHILSLTPCVVSSYSILGCIHSIHMLQPAHTNHSNKLPFLNRPCSGYYCSGTWGSCGLEGLFNQAVPGIWTHSRSSLNVTMAFNWITQFPNSVECLYDIYHTICCFMKIVCQTGTNLSPLPLPP